MLDDYQMQNATNATDSASIALERAMVQIVIKGLLEGKSGAEIAAELRREASGLVPGIQSAVFEDMLYQLECNAAGEGMDFEAREAAASKAVPTQSFVQRACAESVGFMLADYQRNLNMLAHQKNVIGYERAAAKAIARANADGMPYVTYTRSGKQVRMSIASAIHRELNSSGNQARFDQSIELARRAGENLVEVNTTANCRESHASWQGGIYMLEGSSQKYPNFYEACHWGDPVIGIGGYNCGHQLRIYREREGRQFKDPLAGTGYEVDEVRALKSTQRRYERGIRECKSSIEAIKAADMDPAERQALLKQQRARMRELAARNNAHIARHPNVLRREQWREKVYTPWYKAMLKPEPPKRKPVEITKPLQSGDVSEFNIGKNVSAAARTDSVRIPSKLSGLSKDIYVTLSQGQKVRGVKIAGRGTGKPIHSELESLREQFPNIDAADWAKYAGNAYVDDMGMKRKAHIHWYEAKDGIRSRMKVVKFHS